MEPLLYSVSEITDHITARLRSDENLQHVWIQGEVSSLSRPASGHMYLTLKDAAAQISCVMWRSQVARLPWWPESGDEIQALGRIDVYRTRGQYQFVMTHLVPVGAGTLQMQFDRLKQKLEQEGLFHPEAKKPLPQFPVRLGVITSREADALRDVLRTLQKRWPVVEVVLFPSLVQGEGAPRQLVQALREARKCHDQQESLDAILMVRGGGSAEDLWAFNDEQVVREVFDCPIPVISGVGHETDFTLVDFVADHRASTPTMAAADAVPEQQEIRDMISAMRASLQNRVALQVQGHHRLLDQMTIRLQNSHPERILVQRGQDLDSLTTRLQHAAARVQEQRHAQLTTATARLESLSPFRVLERGYSMVRKVDGTVVTSPDQTVIQEKLEVLSQHGSYWVSRQTGRESGP